MHIVTVGVLVFVMACIIVIYGICTGYGPTTSTAVVYARLFNYPYYMDIHVMIFIGFGFLMTFLSYGGFTATSHAYLLSVFGILWGILNRGFWSRVFGHVHWLQRIQIDTDMLIGVDFLVAAELISMGAVLGRVTATQLLFMGFVETIGYALNEAIILYVLDVPDVGGAITIHSFGAFCGLAFSYVLEVGKPELKARSADANKSNRTSDLMSMVGTLFLFCYWPSFNAALAVTAKERAVVNTLLSICSSTFSAFLTCAVVYRGKFRMTEVQNSTLAGGVVMGAAADMIVHPFGAMLAGSVVGVVSVLGYRFVTPFLAEKVGLRDTCGVLNLHGIPGIAGAMTNMIVSSAAHTNHYHQTLSEIFTKANGRTSSQQGGVAVGALFISIGIGMGSGVVSGAIARFFPSLEEFFTDEVEYSDVASYKTGDKPKEMTKEEELKQISGTEPTATA